MKIQQQERTNRLRELIDNLAFVMTDAQVMESTNAAVNFRKLLAIDRWLNQDRTDLNPRYTRLPVPEEVAPANYSLHQSAGLASELPILAEIVGLGTRQCAMTVFARFPECTELTGISEFIIGFEDNDPRFEIVEFLRVDTETGAPLDVPSGALLGLYAALITTCRDELDQWRINAAELEDISLEPAKSPENE